MDELNKEEVVTEVVEPQTEQEVVETPQELSEAEKSAMERGWVPKDQWKGDPDAWRPAKEFNDRGELIGKIMAQGRELEQLKAAVNHMTRQQQKAYIAGFENAIAQVKARRDAAIEQGDLQAVQTYNDKLDDIKDQFREAKAQVASTPPVVASNPEGSDTFKSWHSQNKWYEADRAMTVFAEAEGIAFKQSNPNSTEADMLQHVEKAVKKEFAHKFQRPYAPNPDGEGRNTSRQSNSSSNKFAAMEAQMSPEDKEIMNTILKTTKMTKEEYFKEFNRR